jgi:metal-dependent amidase/aminoacylase/carboxypeptidase family protein
LARAAAGRAGLAVIDDWPPSSGGEDFSFFLDRVPGAFLLLGNGETEELHHPAYDFNDNALAYGIRALVSLAEFRP